MMKRIILIIFLFFIIPVSKADIQILRSYMEIMGQYNFLPYSTNLLSINSEFERYVCNSTYAISFNGVLIFDTGEKIYGFYLKKDHIDTKNKSELLLSGNNGYNVVADEKWGMHYLGFGIRKYFIDNFIFNSFLPYLAIDAGFYFTSNTTAKLTVKNSSDVIIADATYEGRGAFMGLNLEAGIDYWLSSEFGISIKSGYRFCNGTIDAIRQEGDLKPAGISDLVKSNIDYSGLFINIGISFLFQKYD